MPLGTARPCGSVPHPPLWPLKTADSSCSIVIHSLLGWAVSAGEEKSGILYVHIYLPATGLQQQAGPPAPAPPQPCSQGVLFPRRGQSEGGQRWLAEGECKMRSPHQTLRGEGHLPPTFTRQSLLRSEESPSLGRRVAPSPLAGEALKLRTSVSGSQPTLFSNSLKQTRPWGSKGRMTGVTAGRAWREARASKARTRQRQQCADTGRQLQTMHSR